MEVERTIYELCKFYDNGKCNSPETPKLTPDCIREQCAVFVGYLPVEPVKLEVLTDEEIKVVEKAFKWFKEATIAHNEAKFGKLYRRKE